MGGSICTSDSEPEQLSAEAKGRLRAMIEKGSFDIGAYLPATPSHGAIVPIWPALHDGGRTARGYHARIER